MATVLGLSFYFHDAAAALVKDGRIVAAAAEERFSRQKHTDTFPRLAIEYCIAEAGLQSVNEIDAVVFYEKPLRKMVRVVETLVQTWPRSLPVFTRRLPDYLKSKVNIPGLIARELPGYHGPILFSEHHLSHAASAYYCSPYDEAAILTIDGVGESETTVIGVGRGQRIQLERAMHFPHSVGLLYSSLTSYLGFRVNDAEWKVMGLAPYGHPTLVDRFRRMVTRHADGSFALDLGYFAFPYSTRWSANHDAWQRLFGIPPRQPDAPLEAHHHDLARSGQAVVEELILGLAAEAQRVSGSRNLVLAGGVALNSVANWKVEQSGLFDSVWIQPAAGDDGGALGAALSVSQTMFGDARTPPMVDAYLGPAIDEDEVEALVAREGLRAERCSDEELVTRVAGLLNEGKVVGWARGRMEFGPRSLGARSILASPRSAEMKALVNEKIKYREFFRPFAPSVPIEHVHEYFEVAPGTSLPFMLKIPQVRASKRAVIPAVTHEDGTGRVQTVEATVNPVFHALLTEVGRQCGVPVLLNTSFNVRGEPVVCSAEDAWRCFMRTGIDVLVLGNHLIESKPAEVMSPEQGYAMSSALEAGQRTTTESVLEFYKQLPFNAYSGSVDMARQLSRKDRVREYPVLHRHLTARSGMRVLDVGCGAGWFANSVAHFYEQDVTGLDLNPVALRQARRVAVFMAHRRPPHFEQADILTWQPDRPYDVVNSLGVLHHTEDCHCAIRAVCEWVAPGGYLHLGLYHGPGRRPFLDHFAQLRAAGATEQELFDAFAALTSDMEDRTHQVSWFRDQVLHPHETQHTHAEIAPLLEDLGFTIKATSLNNYRVLPDASTLARLEAREAARSQRALARGRYRPGFFVIWAQRGQR